MKAFKYLSFMIAPITLVIACSHTGTHTDNGRDVASTRKAAKRDSETCEAAYRRASNSPSTGDVADATDICDKVKESLCVAKLEGMAGTGDGRYIGAMCGLTGDYGANKAVNDGKAVAVCEEAHEKATASPSTGDVMDASEVCQKSTTESCAKQSEKDSDGGKPTGDSRYVSAFCGLMASHGAVIEIKGVAARCKEVRNCTAKCPKNSEHPGMCPATCKQDFDPTNICGHTDCKGYNKCLKSCNPNSAHPNMCPSTCQQDYDSEKSCK